MDFYHLGEEGGFLVEQWDDGKLDMEVSLNQTMNGMRVNSCPVVRETCKKALNNMNKADNNSPIILDKLAFGVFLQIKLQQKQHEKQKY